MCYPEVATALPSHLHLIEELQFDIGRIPNQPVQNSDYTIFEDLFAQLSHCHELRLLKIGVGLMGLDFPSNSACPTVPGPALVKLAEACPKMEDINLLAAEPSAIDASGISAQEFDEFCRALPHLRNLNLKLHSATATALEMTALQSLGTHCPELEVLRLRLPFQLPSLPVPNRVPQILINGELTPGPSTPAYVPPTTPSSQHSSGSNSLSAASSYLDVSQSSASSSRTLISPLFPRLTHLAISRPETVLSTASDTFTVSSSSQSASEIVDPELEEDIVRAWAHPLLTHFPCLEILEAWSDCAGQDNESLNYFLPTEEILASTWEFLSGVEQDLWEDDEELEEDDSWHTLQSGRRQSGEDWDKASLMNEYVVAEQGMGNLSVYEEEPEGTITPGRTVDQDGLF